jgi:ParB family protein of integrating conjugative element (PFGI_1 class)
MKDKEASIRHDSYSASNPTPSPMNLKNLGSVGGAILKLDVMTVQRYDKNPRLFANEQYEDIAASIDAQGQNQPLSVTQREPNGPYFISAGGNTRLEVLQRRYEQTKDPEYRYAYFFFTPYKSEEQILAQHLTENFSRGAMRFWESAKGVSNLVDMINARSEKPLPLRDIEAELLKQGLRVGRSQLSRYLFAVNRLAPLEGALEALVGQTISDVYMPRLNLAAKLGTKFGLDEDEIWADVFTPVLHRAGLEYTTGPNKTLDASEVCDSCEVAIAEVIGHSLAELRIMLNALRKGDMTLIDLKALLTTGGQTEVLSRLGTKTEPIGDVGGTEAESSVSDVPPETGIPQSTNAAQVSVTNKQEARTPDVQAAKAATPTKEATQQSDQPQKDRLHEELSVLCDLAGIGDLLVWRKEMPLGFFVDYPAKGSDEHIARSISSDEVEALNQRTAKSIVFWTLIRVSGQLEAACAEKLDPASNFFKAMTSDAGDADWLENTEMGSAMRDEDVLVLATKPEFPAVGWMLKVLYTIRELNTKS